MRHRAALSSISALPRRLLSVYLPHFAQVRFLDEPGACANADPGLVFADLTPAMKLPAVCVGDLIYNGDFEAAGPERWSHEVLSGARMAVATEPLSDGGVNTYGVSARRRKSQEGPSQYLDTRCFFAPAAVGSTYLLSAQVRVGDASSVLNLIAVPWLAAACPLRLPPPVYAPARSSSVVR
jgi:hypothetical protein